MLIHKDLNNYRVKNPIITMGMFDGVHKGHRFVLKKLKEKAKSLKGESVVISFNPHPREFFSHGKAGLSFLTTLSEKTKLLDDTGIDHFVILKFDNEFSQLSACEFIEEYLVKRLKVKHLLVGFDHQFGKNRKGDYNSLERCASNYGFGIERLEMYSESTQKVSSSRIRELIELGDVLEANNLLTYKYSLTGRVVDGYKIGRRMGFPTANILVDSENKLMPGRGVYAVSIDYKNHQLFGMLNIGIRPTFERTGKISIEVNIFDFRKEIYNEKIKISFIQKIRNEQKFNDASELKAQLEKDRISAKQVISIFYKELR